MNNDEERWVCGNVECPVCCNEHISVHYVGSERLECPKCGYGIINPDYDSRFHVSYEQEARS